MRFSTVNAIAVLSAATLTAATPVALSAPAVELAPRAWDKAPKTGGVAPRDLVVRNTDTAIQKREIVTAIVVAAGTAAVTAVVDAAVKAAGTLISQIANFDNVSLHPSQPLRPPYPGRDPTTPLHSGKRGRVYYKEDFRLF